MSLHTQYRPTKLDDVVGQGHVVRSLKQVIKQKRAQSFLFVGPSGVGKTTLARIVAAMVCDGELRPQNLEEIDAADHSGADSMRAIVSRSMFRAIGARPTKTIVVDECHRLSAAAWSVLLKPIEEPPKHVYWMLCTTDPGKIPKTIITRCLRYDLKPVGEDELLSILVSVCDQEGLGTGDDILADIAEAANGSPRQALVFLEGCSECKTVAEARQVMRSIGQSPEVIELCRWLINPRGGWPQAIKLIKAFEGIEAESIRINIVRYLSAVLLNTQGEQKAKQLLMILEQFGQTYYQADGPAPLLRSVALALGMDQ